MSSRRHRSRDRLPWNFPGRGAFALSAFAAVAPSPSTAQLRPLDPIDWQNFSDRRGACAIGVAAFRGHPASLTGTEGRLLELGLIDVSAHFGRVVIRISGSAYRAYEEVSPISPPASFVRQADDDRRFDRGDFEISTVVRFRSGEPVFNGAVRFGARLPTTDEEIGLERDQTDFFLTLMGRHERDGLGLQVESGLGVHGVAGARFDQTDPWLFMLGLDYGLKPVLAAVQLVGQYDTRENGAPRGNEHLAEVRFRVRTVGRTWIEATAYRGIASYSPELGFALRLGRAF